MDRGDTKNDWRAQAALEDRLRRIQIRRAKLLGPDAPIIYQTGVSELSAERLERERTWQALPVEEQIHILEALTQPRHAGNYSHCEIVNRPPNRRQPSPRTLPSLIERFPPQIPSTKRW